MEYTRRDVLEALKNIETLVASTLTYSRRVTMMLNSDPEAALKVVTDKEYYDVMDKLLLGQLKADEVFSFLKENNYLDEAKIIE